jgi:hypothetical protein
MELMWHSCTGYTIEKSCKTTNIVIAISSHEDIPKPPRILLLTMTKVLIEFHKNYAAKKIVIES